MLSEISELFPRFPRNCARLHLLSVLWTMTTTLPSLVTSREELDWKLLCCTFWTCQSKLCSTLCALSEGEVPCGQVNWAMLYTGSFLRAQHLSKASDFVWMKMALMGSQGVSGAI